MALAEMFHSQTIPQVQGGSISVLWLAFCVYLCVFFCCELRVWLTVPVQLFAGKESSPTVQDHLFPQPGA